MSSEDVSCYEDLLLVSQTHNDTQEKKRHSHTHHNAVCLSFSGEISSVQQTVSSCVCVKCLKS